MIRRRRGAKRAKGMRGGAALLALFALLLSGCAMQEGKVVRQEVAPLYSAASPEFRQATGSLLGSNFAGGNRITTLVNGREIFPAMLRAIHSARKSIDFETYIFWDGQIGREFAEALAERARAGVKVNAILDAQGTNKMGSENLARLRSAGVDLVKYHSIVSLDPRRYNNRSHRKLLIIDGRTAFIGGVGIADEWLGNGEAPEHWRDNHYKVTGPVVAQLQAVFMDNWLKTRGEVLHGPDYFPPLTPTGPYTAQAFKSSPRQGDMDIHLMYLLAIASAQHNLLIENAYFLPDDLMRKELMNAAKRGAKVEIVIPGDHIDQKAVRAASRKHWPELLQAGIRIYEYQPAMVHVKLMIVDGAFVSVGSGNFDIRSIRLNDEANLNVLSPSFATEQARLFEKDKRSSREVTLDDTGHLGFLNPVQQAAGFVAPEL
ncbi:MAG: phospholipase D-like domain-containing protein [Chthoniobacterales bacterium]